MSDVLDKLSKREKAISTVCSFLINHMDAGSFWTDADYNEEILALKVLYPEIVLDRFSKFMANGGKL